MKDEIRQERAPGPDGQSVESPGNDTKNAASRTNRHDDKMPAFLSRYATATFATRLKARFLLQINLVCLVLLVVLLTTSVLMRSDTTMGSGAGIFMIEGMGLAVVLLSLLLLHRGWFDAAAHLLVISGCAIVLLGMWVDDSSSFSRLNTVVILLPMLAMVPLIISRRGEAVALYAAASVGCLSGFLLLFRHQLGIPGPALFDYFIDTAVAIVLLGFVSYNTFRINRQVLEKMEEEFEERRQIERDRETLQKQMLQIQKMESIGRLAGGVAHDFNNMLSVILGYTELGLRKTPETSPLRPLFQEIHAAGKRSSELTRQLLAFARKQVIDPKTLDLNETVEGMLKMLRRLIGEQIRLEWKPGSNLGLVRVDPSQVDQILANLCVNARDAITGSGTIVIETANAQPGGTDGGDFVKLSVSDSGHGMDQETLEHIFEPFFTTKSVGYGTGLGLATVFGIVQQSQGTIRVRSEVGVGTTFTILLPTALEEPVKISPPVVAFEMPKTAKTVLLVEDEAAILKMVAELLGEMGFKILTASSPIEALELAEGHSGSLDLLLTDVVMPEMDGKELSRRLLERYPRLKCLFMSGYLADVVLQHGVDLQVQFIQKPFTIEEIGARVRAALEEV